ncbi:MAG: hydantoinase/oxoprolinase family protein [Peptococcaceae bacterium]|nr:hydantoinase/oxoprolinase family protein [Peptococcaceae bacterium]
MYIGLDVGGTYTDAVLLEKGQVRAWAKVPTRQDLLTSLLEAFDKIMAGAHADLIERVVLSTTVITNLIAEKKYDPVGLILIPGPGLDHSHYRYDTETCILGGAIDYRGREIVPLDSGEIDGALARMTSLNYKKVAVVGKFSSRNNKHEQEVFKRIRQSGLDWQVELGHRVAGQLNFPRRVMSTLLTCATREKYQFFADSVLAALDKRGIRCPVYILKADGGTMPLHKSLDSPVETIFSGPAASILGVQALIPPGETAVVVDIGGTTSDLALILSGQPLLSSKGANIDGKMTHVRALAVKSVPVGGDSVVEQVGKEIILLSERMGPPYCMGGPMPTPTDALKVLGLTRLGDLGRAKEAMRMLGRPLGMQTWEVAARIMLLVTGAITSEINKMFMSWEQEPAYRVWEVLQKRKDRPNTVVGVGGAASGFLTQIAATLNCYPVIPPYARVANAVGAAVARPTLQVSLRADTEQGTYSIQEEGFQGPIEDRPFNEEKALELARYWLGKRAEKYGLKDDLGEVEVIRKEVFNMVRDWVTRGKLIDVAVQTRRGILHYIGSGVERDEK